MAQTCADMATEVQARCGRSDDAALITSAQICTWFNEAQADIVRRIPNLHATTFKNTTSHDTTQSLAYAVSDITAGDYTTQAIANIWEMWYLDGVDSHHLSFVPTDEFDKNWPDPTNADSHFGKPTHWTRRGGNIEIRPVCACDYFDKDLRFDGDFYPRDLSADSTQYSDLSMADEGLKDYALSKAFRAIGDLDLARDMSVQYEQWMDVYMDTANRMLEWPGLMYGDNIT